MPLCWNMEDMMPVRKRAKKARRHADGRFAGPASRSLSAAKSGGSVASPTITTYSVHGPSQPMGLRPGTAVADSAIPGFDRRAYQRVYCRLRRKHGKVRDWPDSALAELRQHSRGTRIANPDVVKEP